MFYNEKKNSTKFLYVFFSPLNSSELRIDREEKRKKEWEKEREKITKGKNRIANSVDEEKSKKCHNFSTKGVGGRRRDAQCFGKRKSV